MPQHLIPQCVAPPHDVTDYRVGALALVLDGLVQRRIELLALEAEGCQSQPGQHRLELVGHRFERTGFQITVTASPIQVVENRK